MLKLDATEQQLVEDLKAKYSSVVAARAQDPDKSEESRYALSSSLAPAAVPGAAAGKQSDVDVKLCQCCNGTGLTVEEYNHRRLEKFCTSCEGKGVRLYRNGAEVLESSLASTAPVGGKPAWAQDVKERRSHLESSISSIDAKIEAYQQEKHQACSRGVDQDPERCKLQQELEVQLDGQIQRLTKAREELQRSLQRMQTSEGAVTADS